MAGRNIGIVSILTLTVIMGGIFVAIFILAAPEINFPTSRLPVGITNTARSVDIGPSKNTRVITNGNTTNEKGI
jgi:hypothetical protein